jgi:hypothetical protein
MIREAANAFIYALNICMVVVLARLVYLHMAYPKKMEAFWFRFCAVWIESKEKIFNIPRLDITKPLVRSKVALPVNVKTQNCSKQMQIKKRVTAFESVSKHKEILANVSPIPPPAQNESNSITKVMTTKLARRKSISHDTKSDYSLQPISNENDHVFTNIQPQNPLDELPFLIAIPFRIAETTFDVATDIAAGSIRLFVMKPFKLYTFPATYLFRQRGN